MTHRADCTLTKAGKKAAEDILKIVYDEARVMAQGGAGPRALNEVREDAASMAKRKYGLELINSGSGRMVFQDIDRDPELIREHGSCVLKIAYWHAQYHDLGYRQNRNEIEVWNHTAPVERDLFVPVKDWDKSDYRWLSMSRVKTRGITIDDVADVRERAEGFGWECTDLKPENVGRIHGENRILDYAHCSIP